MKRGVKTLSKEQADAEHVRNVMDITGYEEGWKDETIFFFKYE